MSTTTAEPPAEDAAHTSEDEAHHPSDVNYIFIAIWLAAITGIEIALSYIDLGSANAPLLLILMVIKFAVVAAYFMHLKLDNRLLTGLFCAGIGFAVGVYCVALLAFEFWS
jgi:cytochrome c oxidase subunit IV